MDLKIITCITPDYVDMLHRFLLPEVTTSEVVIHWVNDPWAQHGSVPFLHRAFFKMRQLREYAKTPGHYLFCDADQRFFRDPGEYFASRESEDLDMAFMNEMKGQVCTGVIYFRGNPATEAFFASVVDSMEKRLYADQGAVQFMLRTDPPLKWELLPVKLFVSGWKKHRINIQPETILYHANWTDTLEDKVQKLEMAGRTHESAKAYDAKYGRVEPKRDFSHG